VLRRDRLTVVGVDLDDLEAAIEFLRQLFDDRFQRLAG
jgi:hypothetical protein